MFITMQACVLLRILNSVRNPEVGIPLTYAQFCQIGLQALLERLFITHHHRLAAELAMMARVFSSRSKLLALKTKTKIELNTKFCMFSWLFHSHGKGVQKVLLHWAMAKLPSMMDIADSLSLELLRKKLASSHGISYARVAREAHTRSNEHPQHSAKYFLKCTRFSEDERDSQRRFLNSSHGHQRRWTRLFMYCANQSHLRIWLPVLQVSLLNFVGDYKYALAKAIESGDADLIYLSIFQLQRHLSFQVINNTANARLNLFACAKLLIFLFLLRIFLRCCQIFRKRKHCSLLFVREQTTKCWNHFITVPEIRRKALRSLELRTYIHLTHQYILNSSLLWRSYYSKLLVNATPWRKQIAIQVSFNSVARWLLFTKYITRLDWFNVQHRHRRRMDEEVIIFMQRH